MIALYIYQLVLHTIASFQDIRSREIDARIMYATLASVPIAALLGFSDPRYVASALFGLVLSTVLLLKRLTGLADVISIAAVSAGVLPLHEGFDIPGVAILLNSLLVSIAIMFYQLAVNLARFHKCPEFRGRRFRELISLLLFGYCERVEKVLDKPYKYIVALPHERVDVEHHNAAKAIRERMERMSLSPNDYVLVTYGVPMIATNTLGIALYVFGLTPLRLLPFT